MNNRKYDKVTRYAAIFEVNQSGMEINLLSVRVTNLTVVR